jgi:transportin-3
MNNPGSLEVRGHPVPQHVDNVHEELKRIQFALSAVFSPSAELSTISMTTDNTPIAMLRNREVADRYLTSFQHLPIAWMVCDQMLQDVPENATAAASQSAMSRHFFAAQTLHTKCREDVHQLPMSSLPSLRESLVDHFLRFSASSPPSPRALVTRLGLALSALAVQMCWTSVVTDMLDRFRRLGRSLSHQHQQEQKFYYTNAMLDLFHLLPEEACSDRLFLINDQLQNDYRAALHHSVTDVLELLVSVLRQTEQNPSAFFFQHVEKVFLCLQTWLRYTHIPPQVMDNYFSLIHAAFHALTREELLEVAIDTIVELLRAYPTSPNPNGTALLICRRVVPHVLSLKNQPEYFAKAMEEEDHDRLRGYCRIVTELSESCMSWILSAEYDQQEDKQQTLLKDQVVDLALLCSAIPENGEYV